MFKLNYITKLNFIQVDMSQSNNKQIVSIENIYLIRERKLRLLKNSFRRRKSASIIIKNNLRKLKNYIR